MPHQYSMEHAREKWQSNQKECNCSYYYVIKFEQFGMIEEVQELWRRLKEMKQIVLTAVEKSYGFGKKKTSVLKQVNLTVRHGECLVIYGERESGKTTLLELLAGIKEVDDGEIQVGTCELMFASKEEIAKLRRTTIGIYSQEHVPLLRGLSVADNLEMMRQLSGNKQAFEAQKQAVQTFGIERC